VSNSISVLPETVKYELLLTADSAISHHDPAIQSDSNRLLFNKQAQFMHGEAEASALSQEMLNILCAQHDVPVDVADILRDLSFPEFVATCLTRLFLDMYNAGEGTGLFEGMERYARLETRLAMAAASAARLRGWWDRLTTSLQAPVHGGANDLALLELLTLPRGVQQAVLKVLAKDARSTVAIARLWHTTMKLRDEQYAQKAGKQAMVEPLQVMHFDATKLPGVDVVQILEVPAVSGNSVRHQLVRAPAFQHLCARLGLKPAAPGLGPLPSGVEAIFENGGNIEAGAKQPSNTFALAWKAREAHPVLDLLGGVTDSFDLGESRLRVNAWLVCAENRDALAGTAAFDMPEARVSAFEMLEDVTHTRQASERGEGQMIYTFETLIKGAKVLARLTLAPFAPALTRGSLVAAVETFLAQDNTLGGQAARGFGAVRGEWLARPEDGDARAQYEKYLEDNKETLVAGLRDGTLGTGHVILT
jgi:hypothetical protein